MHISQGSTRRPWVTSHSHWVPRGAVVLAWQARSPEDCCWPPCLLLISHLGWAGVQVWGLSSCLCGDAALVGLRGRTRQPGFWGGRTQQVSEVPQIESIWLENSRCNALFIALQQTNATHDAVIYLCYFATLVEPKDNLRMEKKNHIVYFMS